MVKRLALMILAALMQGLLPACEKKPPLPPSLAVGQQGVSSEYLTARTGWELAQTIARKRASDAQLVLIEGRWIDPGGYSHNWSYQFVSPEQKQKMVIQAGEIQLIQPAASPYPNPIDSAAWIFDSDAALTRLSLVQQLSYPLTSMTLDSGLLWRVIGPAGSASTSATLP